MQKGKSARPENYGPPLVEFYYPRWIQVNLRHPHKNEAKIYSHTTTKWFSGNMQNQVDFDPPL